MIRRAPITLLGLAALGTGCSSDPATESANPSQLWLALDGSELKVRLIDHEPKPY